MNRFTAVLASAFVPFVIICCVGCVDTTPLLDAPIGDGGGAVDGTMGLAKDARSSAETVCRECVYGDSGACRAPYEACSVEPNCKIVVECTFELGCYAIAAFQDRLACVDPCLKRANIATITDPILQGAIDVNLCMLDSCGPSCIGDK
jgi:hypothetical protein